MQEEIMTVEELARYLRTSATTVYKLAQEGTIPASKVGNQWRFVKGKIDRWLDKSAKGRILSHDRLSDTSLKICAAEMKKIEDLFEKWWDESRIEQPFLSEGRIADDAKLIKSYVQSNASLLTETEKHGLVMWYLLLTGHQILEIREEKNSVYFSLTRRISAIARQQGVAIYSKKGILDARLVSELSKHESFAIAIEFESGKKAKSFRNVSIVTSKDLHLVFYLFFLDRYTDAYFDTIVARSKLKSSLFGVFSDLSHIASSELLDVLGTLRATRALLKDYVP